MAGSTSCSADRAAHSCTASVVMLHMVCGGSRKECEFVPRLSLWILICGWSEVRVAGAVHARMHVSVASAHCKAGREAGIGSDIAADEPLPFSLHFSKLPPSQVAAQKQGKHLLVSYHRCPFLLTSISPPFMYNSLVHSLPLLSLLSLPYLATYYCRLII